MKKIAEIKEDLKELSLPIGFAMLTATPEHEILFTNERFAEMLGFSDGEEFLRSRRSSAWHSIYGEDLQRLQAAASTRLGIFEPYEIDYRAIKKDGSLLWVNQNSRHTRDEDGRELIFAYYTDITQQKQMEQTIRAGVKKYETLVNSVPGGVGMYQLNETFSPLFMSERVYELCGMTKEEYCAATRRSTLDVFHPDDRQGLIDAARTAYEENRKFEYTHRVLQGDGSYRWMRVSGQVMAAEDGTPALYTVFTDVHEQIQAERALRESEFRYATAIKASNINIWEYVYETDTVTIFSTSPKVNPQSFVLPDYLHSFVAKSRLREDSSEVLRAMLERLKSGEREARGDLWIQEENGAFWCERVLYTNLFDDNGCPVKAYCVGHDVTKEKEAEKRYLAELSYREAMQKATLASININLTKDTILDYKSNFAELAAHMANAKTSEDYFDQLYAELTSEEMQREYRARFGRDALLRHFADGETTLSMELTRRIEGRRYWVALTVHMMKRPEDQNIVAFLYSTDITNEKTMQNIMNAIVKTDYDFLVVVDGLRNFAVRYSEKDFGKPYAHESTRFEQETQDYVRRFVCKEDVARVVEEITVENILAQLDAHESYSIFYAVPDAKGRILRKQLHFSYINRELKSFLMTRVDITAAVEEQEKKNQELVEAVAMAERANAAKSEFLSRISHEIRTPMNAIMGMDQLAIQRLNDPPFVLECIEKSQYAAQYLLLLLGDILDMSKIESGKVTLKNEVIFCRRFLDAIDTIIGAQAAAKGVHYVVTEFEGRKNCYLGDSVRLRQILINILSNAIKFTPSGGTVRLDITQIGGDEKHAQLRFQISDTGIGISEAFLPKLFQPFSQESHGSNSGYGGSGLGLAISKNLTQMMGGEIVVQSAPGRGTVFGVMVPLGIAAAETERCAQRELVQAQGAYDFSGKKILLVEDHQLNIMVAKKLLEFKNACVDVAENGEIGLARFAQAGEAGYDAILMDIRMPVMDGLESAAAIRSLASPRAKTVPIIAMSANAFDEDIVKSRSVGMNAHLSKPIDAELLYETLDRLMAQGETDASV